MDLSDDCHLMNGSCVIESEVDIMNLLKGITVYFAIFGIIAFILLMSVIF